MPADPFLRALVELVDRSDFAIGITLNVHGLTITGEMIGRALYFQSLGRLLETTPSRAIVQEFAAQLLQRAPRKNEILCIHLRDAYIAQPNGAALPARGTWWRGRVDAVDGFFLGRLQG